MKKGGVLNHRLSEVIARMGHTDQLVIGDAGLPIPPGIERIDLAVTMGVPPMMTVVGAVASELQVERIVLAEELRNANPELVDRIASLFPEAELEWVSHDAFKQRTAEAVAIVRTGECTPYANVILCSGVIF
jgi:D-ribose pyranase